MKRFLLSALLIISVFIQACATGRWDYQSDFGSAVPGGYEKNYQLGVKKSVYIGQEMIHVIKYGETIQSATPLDNYTIQFSTKLNQFRNDQLFIDKNKTYTLGETINLSEKYYLLHLSDRWCLLVSADGRTYTKSLYDYHYKAVYTPEKDLLIESQNIKFLLAETYVLPLSSFDLIYVGKNDVSLNITYREYTGDDRARPAFFQNLTYNADAKQIRFKDFLIQIHDVTNEKITYTILEDGLR